jgi:excisionase family DNA binding protein
VTSVPQRYVTSGQAAKHLGVSPATVSHWCQTGKIPALRTPGGHYRIPVEALDTIFTEPAPTEAAS